MKQLIAIVLFLVTIAIGADYKPFTYANVPADSASQQAEFDYMLQYKLYGTDYIKMGRRVIIPDKSGWNGSSGPISSAEGISLGGPVLTDSTITLGDQCQFTTGPIRAKSLTTGNDNGQALFAGNICLTEAPTGQTPTGIARGEGKLSCDSVPPAPVTLQMPTIVWPTEGYQNDIILTENNQADTIYVPEGDGQYDLYYKNIHTCVGGKNGCKIYVKMEKNRLTRIFVDSLFIGNHTTISVILGDSVLPQSKYRGNVLIYSNKNIIFDNTDNVPIQGSFITTAKMYLKCNLDFAGQMLANQLEIGDDFKGENFRFVKFDPDTLDFPELNKQGGLKENDSTVIIPISLSDTATIDVYFTYCFDLKDGVTVEDFNMPPYLPICGDSSVTTRIPVGSKSPLDTIKVNVKIDTLTELNDILIMRIDSITGAILPNGETSGELKIKIIDAIPQQNKSVVLDKSDTIKTYQEELHIPPSTGVVGNIKYTDDGLAPLIWSVEDPSGLFTVVDGVIITNHVFDYETEDTTYVIKVKVADGEFLDSANYLIKIENIQEPITVSGKVENVNENTDIGTPIGAIIGKDADSTAVTYSINTTDFKIDQTTGVITVNTLLDYETKTSYPVKVTVKSTDGSVKDTSFVIKVLDIDEPVHAHDTTLTADEGKTGPIGTITGEDEDGKLVKFYCDDTVHYSIDSISGVLRLVEPFDYEKKTKDTVKVIVTDGEFSDTATVIIRVLDEPEKTEITEVDDKPKVDTIKTNEPDHKIDYRICEGDKCEKDSINVTVHRDTTIKVCNEKKTSCDQVVILFNDAPPVVTLTLTNANSTDALIDYITIEEQKDNKIYVNKKNNDIQVTVKDTVHKTEKHFNITVKLDTVPTKDIKLKEYNYLIDESLATYTAIGNGLAEMTEVVKDGDTKITLTQIVDAKTGRPIDTTQTVTYTKKVNGKDVTVSYIVDNLTGQKIGDYNISYNIDSCTSVTYTVNDKKQIVTNKEGNIAYTVAYNYVDDFGNKASANVEIIFDDIPPKVEILEPYAMETFNTNAIPIKWTVNGEIQDTLTLQRLEKGVKNYIIRRYVDKAGNVSADTVMVLMKEAKDIDIEIIHPVTKVNKDKVDEYYSEGHTYKKDNPTKVKFVDPKNDTLPDVIGVGFKVDIVLPSVSPTGSLATLDDIVKNGMIPVDDKGNIVGASTKGIPVDQYVEEHCTEEFKQDYQKHGLNIPLYDVNYNLHLLVYTTTANYVNDFNVEFTLNDEAKTTSAGTVQMVIDWLADKDGHVKAKNGHALGTGTYITKLWSKSTAKHRCDYKEQRKGDKTVKKDDTMKTFGYKRPQE